MLIEKASTLLRVILTITFQNLTSRPAHRKHTAGDNHCPFPMARAALRISQCIGVCWRTCSLKQQHHQCQSPTWRRVKNAKMAAVTNWAIWQRQMQLAKYLGTRDSHEIMMTRKFEAWTWASSGCKSSPQSSCTLEYAPRIEEQACSGIATSPRKRSPQQTANIQRTRPSTDASSGTRAIPTRVPQKRTRTSIRDRKPTSPWKQRGKPRHRYHCVMQNSAATCASACASMLLKSAESEATSCQQQGNEASNQSAPRRPCLAFPHICSPPSSWRTQKGLEHGRSQHQAEQRKTLGPKNAKINAHRSSKPVTCLYQAANLVKWRRFRSQHKTGTLARIFDFSWAKQLKACWSTHPRINMNMHGNRSQACIDRGHWVHERPGLGQQRKPGSQLHAFGLSG